MTEKLKNTIKKINTVKRIGHVELTGILAVDRKDLETHHLEKDDADPMNCDAKKFMM